MLTSKNPTTTAGEVLASGVPEARVARAATSAAIAGPIPVVREAVPVVQADPEARALVAVRAARGVTMPADAAVREGLAVEGIAVIADPNGAPSRPKICRRASRSTWFRTRPGSIR